MVGGQRATPNPGPLTGVPLAPELDLWLKRLQRSLSLEVDHGFQNLQGQRCLFNEFIATSCSQPPQQLFAQHRLGLQVFINPFELYPSKDQAQRRRLVIQLRQHLHGLRKALDPELPIGPPRLRINGLPPGQGAPEQILQLDTPLGQVKAIGPRLATRLLPLGLVLVGDLLRYYPRDYVDYSRLVRINALQSGVTATVVASVRRCHAFASPKNPNLAILELQLQDPTGRLRISKFMAG
ncbi:MAG: DNA helicase RecG, partial [Synechococcaceae bacterium WB6_3B_236]|nr:DNA helicase RecG [Synechococcaceae bacterium WB6_3B_236]